MKMKRKIIMSVTRLGKCKHLIKCVASSFSHNRGYALIFPHLGIPHFAAWSKIKG